MLYATIYQTTTTGLAALGVTEDVASMLQAVTDATTGHTTKPPGLGTPVFPVGATVRIDAGPTPADGWAQLDSGGSTSLLESEEGAMTTAQAFASAFDGVQTGGLSDNAFGWPADVSSDSLWVGTFDGHEQALARKAQVSIRGLVNGRYQLRVFASRSGDDEGNGRLSRYRVGEATVDLEASDNTSNQAALDVIVSDNTLTLEVQVSPEGGARFAYVGVIELERLA